MNLLAQILKCALFRRNVPPQLTHLTGHVPVQTDEMNLVEIQQQPAAIRKPGTVQKLLYAIPLVLLIGFLTYVLVWTIWVSRIEKRAFVCNDQVLPVCIEGFWTDIDLHQSAGDKILPGWTWDEVHVAANVCRVAFLIIWGFGSMVMLKFLWPDSPKRMSAEQP